MTTFVTPPVAFADVAAAVALPAVADTSGAAGIATHAGPRRAAISAPYATLIAPVDPELLNDFPTNIVEDCPPNGAYAAPEPSVATMFDHPAGAPSVAPVGLRLGWFRFGTL
jgi:hypothetical protein